MRFKSLGGITVIFFVSMNCCPKPLCHTPVYPAEVRGINPGYPGTNSFCFSIALDYPDKPGNDVWESGNYILEPYADILRGQFINRMPVYCFN